MTDRTRWRALFTLFIIGIALAIIGFLAVIDGVFFGFIMMGNGAFAIGISLVKLYRAREQEDQDEST